MYSRMPHQQDGTYSPDIGQIPQESLRASRPSVDHSQAYSNASSNRSTLRKSRPPSWPQDRERHAGRIPSGGLGELQWLIGLFLLVVPLGIITILFLYIFLNEGRVQGGTVYTFAPISTLSTITTALNIVYPYGVPFTMALFAFPLARAWLRSSTEQRQAANSNPTPLQLGLLTQLCGSAGFYSLYTGARYIFRHEAAHHSRRVVSAPWILRLAFLAVLLLHILSLGMSAFVLLFQHGSVPVILSSSSPAATPSAYGRQLNTTLCGPDDGSKTDQSWNYTCVMNVEPDRVYFHDEVESMMTSLNTSTTNYAIPIGNHTAIIIQHGVSTNASFSTSTLAVDTQCSVITPLCVNGTLTREAGSCCFLYDCGPTYPGIGITSQGNDTLYPNITQESPLVTNPSVFFAVLNPTLAGGAGGDSGYAWHGDSGTFIIMRCELNVYNVEITQVAATVTEPAITSITGFETASDYLTNIVVGPLYVNYQHILNNDLETDMERMTSPWTRSKDYANIFARQVALHTVAFAAQAVEPAVTRQEIVETLGQGSAIPFVPLVVIAAIVGVHCLIVLVILLFMVAISAGTSPAAFTVRLVQLRLTNMLFVVHSAFGGPSKEALTDNPLALFNEETFEDGLVVSASESGISMDARRSGAIALKSP